MAKTPGYMAGCPENEASIQFHVAGGGEVLHLTWPNGFNTTLRQVDGLDNP